VKETDKTENDRVFIAAEPAGAELTALTAISGHLHFDLAPGTTLDQAREIANYLNSNIASIALMSEPAG
jgi:hypothetical protein